MESLAAQSGKSSVENNALLNDISSKFLRKKKELVELLKENGVKATEDFVESYKKCQTDICRTEVKNESDKATLESINIIKSLAISG